MILVIGGAYQGKLDYVKETYQIEEHEIEYLSEDTEELNFSSKVFYGFDKWLLGGLKRGIPIENYVNQMKEKLADKIIICEDHSCGVVPIDNIMRQYREVCGRVEISLAKDAKSVIRVFLGIGSTIK